MYAYGLFFDRHGEEVLDFAVTEDHCRQIIGNEDDDAVIGKGIKAFVVEAAIRRNFNTINELIVRVKEGKPIVLDEEESLIALAGTRDEAKAAFVEVYIKEMGDDDVDF